MKEYKKIAVIFAGGTGSRMGSEIPKQFLKIYGKEIIIHTLEKFQYHSNIDSIYVGCKEEYIPLLKELIKKYNITKVKPTQIVAGGETGQDTIYNILSRVQEENDENSIVLIHDGVRPSIDDEMISNNINDTIKYGTSITCTPCFETPFITNNGNDIEEILPREKVYTAQAPQCFKLKDILKAHETVRKTEKKYSDKSIVDSSSLMMYTGNKVHLTLGKRSNIKVTTVEDYINLLGILSVEDQKQIYILNTKENKKDE